MNENDAAVLSLHSVTKTFGGKAAVKDVNLHIRAGEIFGFLGPNGAGKSTTIRLILDILRPTSGSITIVGKSSRDIKATHSQIGFLSGDMALDTDLTGKQYLDFVNYSYGGKHAPRISELAHIFEANLHVKIGNYSRGNKQKIGLIAALLHNPKLLILDEPTSGFDPLVQEAFAKLLIDYRAGGGTVFMSSHILSEVQQLCDRVAFIRDGSLVDTKTIGELTQTTSKRVTVLAQAAELTRIKAQQSKLPSLHLLREDIKSMVFNYAGDMGKLLTFFSNFTLTDITIREPELEEIFSHYYEHQESQI